MASTIATVRGPPAQLAESEMCIGALSLDASRAGLHPSYVKATSMRFINGNRRVLDPLIY